MKSVLISIQPKWCELIANGKKTVEVRMTAPKYKEPFKVYIYQTKKKWIYKLLEKRGLYQGKVIGEFVCDRIDKYESEYWDNETMAQIRKSYYADPDDWECEEEFEYVTGNEVEDPDDCALCKQSCLTYTEICKYVGIGDKTFYGWHISKLKIYDKPKVLGEFFKPCGNCDKKGTKRCTEEISPCQAKSITRPPQSWCYVKER